MLLSGKNKAYDDLYMNGWDKEASRYDHHINESIVKLMLKPYTGYLKQDNPDFPIERCCLYEVEDFNWFYTIDDIFDGYETICQENGITPIKFNRYEHVNRVPFMEVKNLKEIHKEIVMTFLDLREHNVYGCGKLPSYVTSNDMMDFVDEIEDREFAIYLFNLASFTIEYDSTLNQMAMLTVIYNQLKHAAVTEDMYAFINECKSKFLKILDPYTDRLKDLGVLPAGWEYSFSHLNDYFYFGPNAL